MSDFKVVTRKRKKTPTVIQMEAVECGAASLAMILEFHGRTVPLEELREACGVTRDGVKASNMLKAARKYGLVARGFKTEPHALVELEVPMIVHWNFNHFLVLEGSNRKHVFLNDPGLGPRRISKEEFDKAFTGVALTFEPGPDFKSGGNKRSLVGMLRSRFTGGFSLAYVLLAGLMLVIPGLVTPIFAKVFIDNILIGNLTGWFRPLLLGMIATMLVQALLTWLQSYYLLRYKTKLAITESGKYLSRLLQLPVGFFTQRMAGDLGRRVRNNIRVADLLTGKLAQAAISMVTVLFYVGLMLYFDVWLTLMGILLGCLNLVVLKVVTRFRQDQSIKLMMESGKLYGMGATGLRLIETLKATGAESDFFSQWAGYHARTINTKQKLGRINYLINVVPPLLSHLTTVAILALGGYLVMNGEMTMGMLVAFQSLMNSFMQPFNQLVRLGGEFQEARGLMEQLDDIYRYERDPGLVHAGEAKGPSKLSGTLEISELSFGYNPYSPPLIENFNLRMKPGSRVALVGPSGSGKSTVSKLVSNLLQPWHGRIHFDGKPRTDWPRESLIDSIAIVDQQIILFEGTIRENLTMWDATISDTRLVKAAKDAAIHEVIMARPNGYDALVEEGGANFSGGQRQRLEIARGLVSDPTFIVLDEATSALDPFTEQLIDDNLRKRGCTCLIVAHRLSTIRDCDEIIVMDRGKIVQRGNHQELADQTGHYAELIKTM